MKISITEEMRFRQRVVEYAIKNNNNAMAARRYGTSRQQVQRWRKKYDGTVQSLANKSRRPHKHPNQHTEEELELLRKNTNIISMKVLEKYIENAWMPDIRVVMNLCANS